jgi:hypothetical protein
MPLRFLPDDADDAPSDVVSRRLQQEERTARFLALWGNNNGTAAGAAAANTATSQAFSSGMTVGQLSLGSERLLYTYVNNTALLTAAALLVVGFVVVAVGLFLYDRLVLGNNAEYANNKQDDNNYGYYGGSSSPTSFLVAPTAQPYGPQGISRIRRYVEVVWYS